MLRRNLRSIALLMALFILLLCSINPSPNRAIAASSFQAERLEVWFDDTGYTLTSQITDPAHLYSITIRLANAGEAGPTGAEYADACYWTNSDWNTRSLGPNIQYEDGSLPTAGCESYHSDHVYVFYRNGTGNKLGFRYADLMGGSLSPNPGLFNVIIVDSSTSPAPTLQLSLDGPTELSIVDGHYSPQTFDITATISNAGTATANNVQVSVTLPDELNFTSLEPTITYTINSLAPGQQQQQVWNVKVGLGAPLDEPRQTSYSVTATADNTDTRFAERNLAIPSLNVSTSIALSQPINISSNASPYNPNMITLETKIENVSDANTISSLPVSFFDGDPEQGGVLIQTVDLTNVAPNETRPVSITWTLNGNLENHKVYARAAFLNSVSTISRSVSVYYTNFYHNIDAYKFKNTDIHWNTGIETTKFLSENGLPAWTPSVLVPVFNFITARGGVCYGMANSSLLYKYNDVLKPIPSRSTYDLEIPEAQDRILFYQWHALVPATRALVGGHFFSPANEYKITLDSIKAQKPLIHILYHKLTGVSDFIHSISNTTQGPHAVVAYKIIELDSEKRVYYYDNRAPLSELNKLGTQIYGKFTGDTYSINTTDPYNAVFTLHEQPSLPDIATQLNKLILDILHSQFEQSITSVSVVGASDLLAVDSSGRRSGFQNGQTYNEIPEASAIQVAGGGSLFLPSTGQYQLQLTGRPSLSHIDTVPNQAAEVITGFSLNIVEPISESTAQVIQFHNIPLAVGQSATIALNDGVDTMQLHMPDDSSIAPSLNTIINPKISSYIPIVHR